MPYVKNTEVQDIAGHKFLLCVPCAPRENISLGIQGDILNKLWIRFIFLPLYCLLLHIYREMQGSCWPWYFDFPFW